MENKHILSNQTLPQIEIIVSFVCLGLVGSFLMFHPKFKRDLYPLIGLSCLMESAYYNYRLISIYSCQFQLSEIWLNTFVNLFKSVFEINPTKN